jgi:molybdopterin synthase catalytic subunit
VSFWVAVSAEEIDVAAMQARLDLAGVGGIATFVGVVRDPDQGRAVSHLTYEAYSEMALQELGAICTEALSQEGVKEVVVRHRTGRVDRGVASVAVVVGAAHRHQALDACTYVIDELKRRAPIWKVEG